MKKTLHQTKIQKTFFCSKRSVLGQESCKIKTKDKSESITSKDKQLKIWFSNCDVFNISKQQEQQEIVPTVFVY